MGRPTVNRIACVVLAIDRPEEPHYETAVNVIGPTPSVSRPGTRECTKTN